MAPHLRLLTKTLLDLEARRITRVIIEAPPRHGKSQLCSIFFPAWYLGRNPTHRIMITSEESQLAFGFSEKIRNTLRAFGPTVFGVAVHPTRTRIDNWKLAHHPGEVYASGRKGGGLTGRGSHLLIVDDPIRSAKDAFSIVTREAVWNWFLSTARSRLQASGLIVVIQCMTGETPVLLADGSHRPLRDIRVGDAVATYEDGHLTVSTVTNWAHQGRDTIYAIRTTSGRLVRANARHPFLVAHADGRTEWLPLRNLTIGDQMVGVSTGENGVGSHALSKAAVSPSPAKASAASTTVKTASPEARDRRPITLRRADAPTSSIGTASRWRRITRWCANKAAAARSVISHRRSACRPTGEAPCASITTTTRATSEDSSATPAISSSATPTGAKPCCDGPLTTYATGLDPIVSITADGDADVFDIQVDRTENFIANGLVSHNTRWHQDDLVGRLLKYQPGVWTRIRLPALAEADDLLGRAIGQPLWPEMMPLAMLEEFRTTSPYWWQAMYQQDPTPEGGTLAKQAWFPVVPGLPIYNKANRKGWKRVRFWDCASTESNTTNDPDWTVGTLMAQDLESDGLFYIEHIIRVRESPHFVNQLIQQTAQRDGPDVAIREEEEPGSSGKAVTAARLRALTGFNYAGVRPRGKPVSWMPLLVQAGSMRVRLVNGPWVDDFHAEIQGVPFATHDDQMDSVSGAFTELAGWQQSAIPGLTW